MGEKAGWQEAVASPGDPKAVVRAEGEEDGGEGGRERGSQEGEREGRGEGWLRLGNPMGCLGPGPERRFSSCPTPVQWHGGQCLLSAGQHNDSISWGFHHYPCSHQETPCVPICMRRGTLPLSLPLHLPRVKSSQPVRSLSPASDWNLHCLWHTRMRAQQGERRPRGALKQEEGPAGVWLGSVFTALSGPTFACLKAGAGPDNSQLSGPCRPPWAPTPLPSQIQTGWLPAPTNSGSKDCGANKMLSWEKEAEGPVNTLTVMLTA